MENTFHSIDIPRRISRSYGASCNIDRMGLQGPPAGSTPFRYETVYYHSIRHCCKIESRVWKPTPVCSLHGHTNLMLAVHGRLKAFKRVNRHPSGATGHQVTSHLIMNKNIGLLSVWLPSFQTRFPNSCWASSASFSAK